MKYYNTQSKGFSSLLFTCPQLLVFELIYPFLVTAMSIMHHTCHKTTAEPLTRASNH